MRSALKRAVMWLYCRGLTPPGFVTWMFNKFRLWAE